MDYKTISWYKYVRIDSPESMREDLRSICQELGILGRILISKEGVNGSVSGTIESIEQFKYLLKTIPALSNLTFREQLVKKNAYHKLVVRVREEICAFGQEVDLSRTGIHLSPAELNRFYGQEDFVIVDARNEYEYAVGRFKHAVKMPIKNFREFPKAAQNLNPYKDKKIVLYCTGGVRCEKASAYLKQEGFKEVFQLQGGIINYVNRHPDGYWEGGLFVFDDRLVSDVAKPITNCQHCGLDCEQYVNCHNLDCDKLTVICANCQTKMNNTCSLECQNAPRQRKEAPLEKLTAKKVIGRVENYYPKSKIALIKINYPINLNAAIYFFGKTTASTVQEITAMRSEQGKEIDFAPAGETITIPVIEKVRKNDKMGLCS
ncbi:MAG TPA: rhodanese-related sulfurtransferase [Candidatus Nanoarchaeia archaeon]|nr:rhodanese-related sulfurtransferase [Candidatus Nanoarchaeia archaeon]